MAIPIAVQLYSVRDDCAKDFAGTLRAVAAMGYDGVEFAGFHGFPAAEVRGWLDETGLKVAGNHCGYQSLQDDRFDETIAYHQAIGCEYLIVPGLPEEMRASASACQETAGWLTSIANKLRPLGLKTGFHCHSADMRPLDDGRSAWDHLASNTPEDFILQYDTSNGIHGGADPVKPLMDWPHRGVTVHLKEYSGEGGSAVIGEGQVPWAAVFGACNDFAGTKWYIVEHEVYGDRTPLECVEACLKNLRGMGV